MDMEEAMIACLKEIVEDLGPVEGYLLWVEYVQEVVELGEIIVLKSFETKGEKL